MRRQVRKRDVFLRLSLIETIAATLGYLTEFPFEILFLTNFTILVWHYRQILILTNWLWNNRKLSPPVGDGIWEQVFDGIHRLQRIHRKKRNDLSLLIKRFKQGSEALPDAVIIFRQDLSIVWCNKLAQRLLGLKWPDDHGQRLDNILRHPDFVSYFQDLDYLEPKTFPSPVNERIMLEFRAMPYSTEQYMLLARDVTQLKHLEQMRKDFVANVSHELRTPLTVLKGYLEMFDSADPPDGMMWQKAHQTMVEQTIRMDSLVAQLLKLSKIESSPQADFEKEAKVPLLLQSIQTSSYALNEKYGHELIFEIDARLDMLGDADELQSVFSNLVYNAIYYTPPNGQICVFWGLKEGHLTFSVTDNGEGIPADKVSRLTERFFRMDKARSRKTGGSGLGLAIVKHILSRHLCQLDIQSTVGQGSCFSFVIPADLLVESAKD